MYSEEIYTNDDELKNRVEMYTFIKIKLPAKVRLLHSFLLLSITIENHWHNATNKHRKILKGGKKK